MNKRYSKVNITGPENSKIQFELLENSSLT
jgi:hypothetical protein